MAFLRKTGQFAVRDTDGNFNIDVGFVPKAMKFSIFCGTSTGRANVDDLRLSYGVYDGTRQRCTQTNDEDGQSPADCFRRMNIGDVIRINQPGSNTSKQLSITALNWATVAVEGVDGVKCSIDWDDVTPEGAAEYLVSWEAFGGSDVEKAECGSMAITDLTTGVKTKNFIDTALLPTALWVWGHQGDGVDTSINDAQFSYGFTDGTNNECISYTSNNDTGVASDVGRGQYSDALFVQQDPTSGGAAPSTDGKAKIDSFNTGNFKYETTNAWADNYDFIYLALQGPQCKVTNFMAPDTGETTGTTDITGTTFTPSFAETASAMHTGTTEGATEGYIHVGFTDGTTQYSTGGTGQNDVNPADTRSYNNDYAFCNKRGHASGGSQGELVFNSWLSNGMRATILQNFNVETYISIMFLGPKSTPSSTNAIRHYPRGILRGTKRGMI